MHNKRSQLKSKFSLGNMIQLPRTFPGPIGGIITIIQILAVVTSFSAEVNPKTRTPYSKFSSAKHDSSTWPSRVAMMVIYTPSFIVSVLLLTLGLCGMEKVSPITIPAPSLASLFCAIHFGKRCLEVMFLHKYSGRTDLGTPSFISFYYTLVTILVAYGADNEINIIKITIGSFLFTIGIVGNFYHHYLLAKLRPDTNERTESKKYVAPRGGLFTYVATPHYLFELIGWLGIAIISNHLNTYLIFTSMSS